jgi:hypothetical protein
MYKWDKGVSENKRDYPTSNIEVTNKGVGVHRRSYSTSSIGG